MTHVSYDNPLWLIRSDERLGQLGYRKRILMESDALGEDVLSLGRDLRIENATDLEIFARDLRKCAAQSEVLAGKLREADDILKDLCERVDDDPG